MLFVLYNYNFITKFVLILSVFIFFRLLREPIMSNNINTDKRICVLKEYLLRNANCFFVNFCDLLEN